jgi:hypothetical protein
MPNDCCPLARNFRTILVLAAAGLIAGSAAVFVGRAAGQEGQKSGQSEAPKKKKKGKKAAGGEERIPGSPWLVHDMNRPRPAVITPGTASTAEQPGQAPSDAVVLFDGKDTSRWTAQDGSPCPWTVENGAMTAAKSSIHTKESFGDVQLHLEWAEPSEVKGDSQGRGNSGVLFMDGRYECQVLDSYNNDTYADGQCSAIYGQNPPMVNCCRPPGQWQTYDIVFHAPKFEGEKVVSPATFTVFQNGVLTQDHWVVKGSTFHGRVPEYSAHEPKLPLQLQFHNNPVRYRNIWIRPLEKYEASEAQNAQTK